MTGATPGSEAVRVAATHLDGVSSLRSGQTALELRISSEGLQIYDQEQRLPVGRLRWTEITALELIAPRRLPPRRAARLILTSSAGRARFALPGLSRRQLRTYLAPALHAGR
jgi:hypothetical protein